MGIFRLFRASLPRRIMGVILTLCCLLLLAVGGMYFLDPYGFQIAPGVSVGQIALSGMSLFEAAHTLNRALEDTLYDRTLTVHFPDHVMPLPPEDSRPQVDVQQALWDAYGLGRWEDGAKTRLDMENYLTIDEAAVRACLVSYAVNHDTVLTESSWSLEGTSPELRTDLFDPEAPCQTLTVTLGYPEAHLDVDAAYASIWETMCQAAVLEEADYAVTVEVSPSTLPREVDTATIAQAVCCVAVNDSLSLETYGFVPGSYGLSFDEAQLSRLIQDAAPGETVSLPMEYIVPEILGDQVYFRDVLGTCETRHTNNENRNTNLRLLCQALDGYVLLPGEEFSYNGVVGERTAEKGYKPAPAYSGNRLVDSIGGGVCQGSTTLYNCVLLADLEVVFRACHGASVGYVPRGLDAAVNYLTTDFQFRNNWNFPIKLQAEVSDGYVKMKILGTDEKDYYIKMESLSGEDEIAVYSRSYKCKYSKETDELIRREIEAYSTYYKNIG